MLYVYFGLHERQHTKIGLVESRKKDINKFCIVHIYSAQNKVHSRLPLSRTN